MLAETFPTPVMHHEGTKETRPAEGRERQRLDRRCVGLSVPGRHRLGGDKSFVNGRGYAQRSSSVLCPGASSNVTNDRKPKAEANSGKPEARVLLLRRVKPQSRKPEARAEGMCFRGAKNVISLSLRFGLRSRYFLVIAANARQQEI